MARPRILPDPVRDWLRERIERDGTVTTARSLDLADATVARAAGGLVVQAGTEAIIIAAFRAEREAA
jgi:hypothetical protein